MMTRTPLTGHTSLETACLVPDYPYSFSLRCEIRFWLEKKDSKGFRLCSQTRNPKNGRWNNPKASTYCALAGAMFKDEKGRVNWTGLSEHSSDVEAATFVRDFPDADLSLLKPFAAMKAALYRTVANSGKAMFSVNGERKDLTATEVDAYRSEAQAWADIATGNKAATE
jgi:hypothetical protein